MSIIFIELSFRLALGRAHTHEPTLSRIRAPVDSETAIVVNGSKAREREVSDAKGNSSTKASVVITRPSCLILILLSLLSRKEATKPKGRSLLAFPVRDASLFVITALKMFSGIREDGALSSALWLFACDKERVN